jgi:hypothetical protein
VAGHGRDELVQAVLPSQTDVATALVPPHFYVDGDEIA